MRLLRRFAPRNDRPGAGLEFGGDRDRTWHIQLAKLVDSKALKKGTAWRLVPKGQRHFSPWGWRLILKFWHLNLPALTELFNLLEVVRVIG